MCCLHPSCRTAQPRPGLVPAIPAKTPPSWGGHAAHGGHHTAHPHDGDAQPCTQVPTPCPSTQRGPPRCPNGQNKRRQVRSQRIVLERHPRTKLLLLPVAASTAANLSGEVLLGGIRRRPAHPVLSCTEAQSVCHPCSECNRGARRPQVTAASPEEDGAVRACGDGLGLRLPASAAAQQGARRLLRMPSDRVSLPLACVGPCGSSEEVDVSETGQWLRASASAAVMSAVAQHGASGSLAR